MSNSESSIVIGLVILAVAFPYVARIRHPEQKLLAAYLIFMSVFGASSVVLFSLFGWLAVRLGQAAVLEQTGPALLFFVLVFVPAFAFATWLARKPPWRQPPPS